MNLEKSIYKPENLDIFEFRQSLYKFEMRFWQRIEYYQKLGVFYHPVVGFNTCW